MKFVSLSVALSLASQIFAQTVYVTSTTVVTVDYIPTGQPLQPLPSVASVVAAQVAPAPVENEVSVDNSKPTTLTQVAVAATLASAASAASAPASPATVAQPSSTPSSNSFADQMLNAHNGYRTLHHSPNLSWSSTLQQYAQAYADNFDCASGNLVHSGGPYGENLYLGATSGPNAVDGWYSESSTYDWSTQTTYDHFTAMIWKSTSQLGCGIKDCSANNWGYYVICSYNDAVPNMVGQAKQNVLPI